MTRVLITGSSGYVASDLVPRLKRETNVFGVDQYFSDYSDLEASIESYEFKSCIDQFDQEEIVVVNLAAVRFDFGASAMDYYKLNVECHQSFTKALSNLNVQKFVHVSSVAALDGRSIPYSETLSCDDAYRATKYLQEVMIQKWCDEHNVALTILYPSAIFSDDPRSDTNIGKLQSVSKFIPFIPKIDVVKSLTYLPNFSRFIIDSVVDEIPSGKYLTIEKPSLTVSKMIQVISRRPIRLVRIPLLPLILKIVAKCLYVLGFFGRIDLKLTPNRVVKLFSDTSYSNINRDDIDSETYAARNFEKLPEILAKFNKK
ncbi:NAD-dependent epimerase/dehydratase family protein [Porticoccaceae bacterium]|nr:NAD-dependent epimerase/dehydratase family protein [Porticoccaceae bacterium]